MAGGGPESRKLASSARFKSKSSCVEVPAPPARLKEELLADAATCRNEGWKEQTFSNCARDTLIIAAIAHTHLAIIDPQMRKGNRFTRACVAKCFPARAAMVFTIEGGKGSTTPLTNVTVCPFWSLQKSICLGRVLTTRVSIMAEAPIKADSDFGKGLPSRFS